MGSMHMDVACAWLLSFKSACIGESSQVKKRDKGKSWLC